jgi:ribosomal peptide maturation radical SAM protein 1
MKVALVALPWNVIDRPSGALGALKAYLNHNQFYNIRCFYEYLTVSQYIGSELYSTISASAYEIGELLYLRLLYPENSEKITEYIVNYSIQKITNYNSNELQLQLNTIPNDSDKLAAMVNQICTSLDLHLRHLANTLADFDVVGLTTCYGQLFANLALAKYLKGISKNNVIILGGSTVSEISGVSILNTFSDVDFVVQGEGERPFLEAIRILEQGALDDVQNVSGIIARETLKHKPNGAELWEVDCLDQLPYPDFDEYSEQAKSLSISWTLPMEGSRGCWWDRVRKTNNPKHTCYFCNLNLQWNGYREKTVDRLVDEIACQVKKYRRSKVFFLDNIVRFKNTKELAQKIENTNLGLELFYEMRANVSPEEIAAFYRAGLRSSQFGIEGLATSFLKKINKGTNVIQNLQVMKTCFELGISHGANIITGFPGTTQDDIDETLKNIIEYAICFEPLNANIFHLGLSSTVQRLASDFGITNLRNKDSIAEFMSEEISNKIQLVDMSYDSRDKQVNWDVVRDICKRWRNIKENAKLFGGKFAPILYYRDAGSFITIEDMRGLLVKLLNLPKKVENTYMCTLPTHKETILENEEADIYRYCMKIRSRRDILQTFNKFGESGVINLLEKWKNERLIYEEDNKYLSLASAHRPIDALSRIEKS